MIFLSLVLYVVQKSEEVRLYSKKPLNSGHLRVLKNLPVITRCPLLGGSLTKIFTLGTKHFVRYSRHVRYLDAHYWEVSLYLYKSSCDNKILSSLIKKTWCTCTLLNHFREANEQLLYALFL